MTALRVRLRDGAVVWQQITRCEPELDAVLAMADEVERWGEGLPLATRALATARAGDQAFTLIAVPGLGSAWVASSALQPGEADGDVVLVEATAAYATRTRCEWEASTTPALDRRHGGWIEIDRGAQVDWVFVRRLHHGQPAGPLSRIAPDDVVERWHSDHRDATAEADALDAVDGPPASGAPEPAAPTSIETLLRFLGLSAADGDAALEVAATPRAASADATTGPDDAALADRTALPWLEGAMPATDATSAATDVAPATPGARVTTPQSVAPQPIPRSPAHTPGEIADARPASDAVDAPSSAAATGATSAASATAAGTIARTAGPSASDAPPSQPHVRPAVPGASPALPSSSSKTVPTPGAARSASASGSSAAPTAPSAPAGVTTSSSAAAPAPSALQAQRASSRDTHPVPSAPRGQVPSSSDASAPRDTLPTQLASSHDTRPAPNAPRAQAPSSSRASPLPDTMSAQRALSHDTRPAPNAPRAQVPRSNDAPLPPSAPPAHAPASSSAAPAPSSSAAWQSPPGSDPPAPSPASSPAPGAAAVPQVRTSSPSTGAQDTPHGSPRASSAAPDALGASRSARIVSSVRGNVDLPDRPNPAPASSRAPHASSAPSQPAPATPRPTADGTRPAPGQPSPTRASMPPIESTTTKPGTTPRARLDSETTTAAAARSSSDTTRAAHSGDAAVRNAAAGTPIVPADPRRPEPTRPAEAVDSPVRAVKAPPPRSRIATARRSADDLGLPAHPAPDVDATPAAHPRSIERSRTDRTSGPAALAPTAALAATVLPQPLDSPPPSYAPATAPSRPQPAAVRQRQGDVHPLAASAPIAHASSTAAIASSAPAAAAPASPTPPASPASASAPPIAPEPTRAPVVASAPAPRTTPAAPAADPQPRTAGRPHDLPAIEGTSVPAVARAHEAPVIPLPRSAPREVNREIHIGDVVVELGEPLPPERTIERAGSLLASLPRPTLRPRRRL